MTISMGSEIRYADSDKVRIAYRVIGDGPRDLLLVLPWFSNLDVVDQYPPIARSIETISGIGRLILFDRRGSGLSDRLCGPATLEAGMDDILAVLEAADAAKPALFGIHEAGTLCMMFAATHPDRVSELVLYGTFATTTWHPDYPWGQKPEERDEQVKFVIETWGSSPFPAFVNPSVTDDPEFLDWASRWQRSSVSRDALPAFFNILEKTDVRHVLSTISVPTLILHREKDLAVPVENARYLHEHIPGSKLVELPGEDQLPFLGEWQPVLEEIEEFLTGERREREPDRVLATILFCDIVDSSGLVSKLGDTRWRGVLDRLDRVVTDQVKRHDGRVVKSLGDGYLATFDRPARAIRCACSIRDAVRDELPLRFGLHTGEAEVRGDDIGGLAVHIAARVMETAEPGEVRVSGAVPSLIAGAGLDFHDRGTHTLRGIPGEWTLYVLNEGDAVRQSA